VFSVLDLTTEMRFKRKKGIEPRHLFPSPVRCLINGQRILQCLLLEGENLGPGYRTAQIFPSSSRSNGCGGAGAELSLPPSTTPRGGTLTRDCAGHEAARRPRRPVLLVLLSLCFLLLRPTSPPLFPSSDTPNLDRRPPLLAQLRPTLAVLVSPHR
jgi:hypothetical protein